MVEFVGNSTDSNSTSGSNNALTISGAAYAKIYGNTANGNGNTLCYELAHCTLADVRHTTMTGFTSVGGIYLNGNTANIFIANTTDGAFSLPDLTTVIGYGPNGKRIVQSNVIPATGKWDVGDRSVNRSPAVGQPKAWICTVAGTPGTWISEGNL